MLFNKDYLFIHIPRTGGKCIKSALIPFLEKPIYLAQKEMHTKFFNRKDFINIKYNFVHFSLEEIKCSAETELPDLNNIKNIIICLRNPLDRAKSLYKFAFFKGDYAKDFESFISELGESRWRRTTKDFCTIDNQIPQNVKFIKFSNLEEDLCNLLSINEIDLKSKKHNEIKHLNDMQKKEFFKVKNIGKVIDSINTWEGWAIQKGLLNSITEKDFL